MTGAASPLPDYSEALMVALAPIVATPSETVDLESAPGRTLREAIHADRDLPPFDRAQMDGYAVRSIEWQRDRAWPVAGMIHAGMESSGATPPGSATRIATGAALPAGLDTVIEHELSDRSDPVRFALDVVSPWRSVHRRGSDARAGEVLLRPRTRLAAHHLGIAASVGAVRLVVARPPRVVVISSGDEVIPPSAQPLTHQVRNSNGIMVARLLERFGGTVLRVDHAPDHPAEAARTLLERAAAESDLIVTIGGVSAGERDPFVTALTETGAQMRVRGAALQPGRPVAVGSLGAATIVALPGNPVSALVCAHLFAWPICCAMLRAEPPPWRSAMLGAAVRGNPMRRAFRPAILDGGGRVTIPSWHGSGDLVHTATTTGIAQLPLASEVPAGAFVAYLAWG